MSRTLNMANRLLARGRNYQEQGRPQDAYDILDRLATFPELPPAVVEETQARMGEIMLHWGKFFKARRHLTAALVQKPDNAHYHYLMAGALRNDDQCDPKKAVKHYRKSLQFDPDQPMCLCEFGELALSLGLTEEGLASLRRAAELAPDDPAVVSKLVHGLEEAGRTQEARMALQAARFRNSRDRRFRSLWNDFQFRQFHDLQQAELQDQADNEDLETGPTLLPFLRPVAEARSDKSRKRIRRDPPSPLPPPHDSGRARVSKRRQA